MDDSKPSNSADISSDSTRGISERQPILKQVYEAIAYMQQASKVEARRQSDKLTALILGCSCILIVGMAYFLREIPQIKQLVFLAPMGMFAFLLASRIGIIRTMPPRQALLTCHMLIAAFLLGITVALMLIVTVM